MKINVGVVFGGRSVEHEVSIISAQQVIKGLDKDKYYPVPIYISKEGAFYTGDSLREVTHFKDIKKLLAECSRVIFAKDENNNRVNLIKYPLSFLPKKLATVDVMFPVLHGSHGEDGKIQGLFETLDVPYVGCNVLSSAITMDKIMTKKVLETHGIPVVDSVWFYSRRCATDLDSVIKEIENKLRYPVIIKPADVGSSIGIGKAANVEELKDALDLARCFSDKILVEKMLVGFREINCSVLGDQSEAKASVCEEPITGNDILTYQDKYMSGGSKGMSGARRIIPAEIPAELAANIKSMSMEAFSILGCCGVIRIDFLLADNKIYINEVNTIPGSLAFYLWSEIGITFDQLLEELILLGLKRAREKRNIIFTQDSNLLASQGIKGIKK